MIKFAAKKFYSIIAALVIVLSLGWIVTASSGLTYAKLGVKVRNIKADQIKLLGSKLWLTDYRKIYLIDINSRVVINQAALPESLSNISIIDGNASQVVLQNAFDGTYKIYSVPDNKFYSLPQETSIVYLTGKNSAITQNIVGDSTSDIYFTNFVTDVSQKIGVWDESFPISLQKIDANGYFIYSEPSGLYNQSLYKLTLPPGKIEKYQESFGFNLKINSAGNKILFSHVDQNGEDKSGLYDVPSGTVTELSQSLNHYLSYFDGDKLVIVMNISTKSYIMVYESGKEITKQPFTLRGVYAMAKYSTSQVVVATKNGLKIINLPL